MRINVTSPTHTAFSRFLCSLVFSFDPTWTVQVLVEIGARALEQSQRRDDVPRSWRHVMFSRKRHIRMSVTWAPFAIRASATLRVRAGSVTPIGAWRPSWWARKWAELRRPTVPGERKEGAPAWYVVSMYTVLTIRVTESEVKFPTPSLQNFWLLNLEGMKFDC